MREKPTDDELTCKDIDDQAFLDEYAFSEGFHDFGDANEELITDLSFCEVMFVERRCSYCSALLRGVIIRGDPPETMREYKRLIYHVYEKFYDNPRSHDKVSLSQGLADASIEIQFDILSTLPQVIAQGCDDAEDVAAKQSRQELWTQILGPEYADTQ